MHGAEASERDAGSKHASTLPRVAAIILNWNARDLTLACLASLERATYGDLEVVVVDNGSVDRSADGIRDAHPGVTLIENGENLGFAGGTNVGLEHARATGATYALLLNADTEVDPDLIDALVRVAEADPQVAAVGPMIYYFDRPSLIWSAGGSIDWRRGKTRMIGMDESDVGQFGTEPRQVDFVSGCCLLLRTDAIGRVGPLDRRFFAYYEEAEWCLRAARAGYRILHAPRTRVWHKIRPAERSESPVVRYYMTRNRLLFLETAGAGWRAWAHALLLDDARTLASWSLRPKWRAMRPLRRAVVRGVLDYFRRRFGRAAGANDDTP